MKTKNAMKATKILELPPVGDCAFADKPASNKRDRNPSLTDHFFKICFNLSVSEI